MSKPWTWESVGDQWHLLDGYGNNRCTVWPSGTWHTWTPRGIGGENDTAPDVRTAKEQATMAVIRQGWAQITKATEGRTDPTHDYD